MWRHPQKPRAKNNQKSAQKPMPPLSTFESLFRNFWIFFDVLFSGFFRQPLGDHFFHFECQTGSPKHPFGGHFGDFLVSGWKRENGVFVLVLTRFRELEGVRILTIWVFFPVCFSRGTRKAFFADFWDFSLHLGSPWKAILWLFFGFFVADSYKM